MRTASRYSYINQWLMGGGKPLPRRHGRQTSICQGFVRCFASSSNASRAPLGRCTNLLTALAICGFRYNGELVATKLKFSNEALKGCLHRTLHYVRQDLHGPGDPGQPRSSQERRVLGAHLPGFIYVRDHHHTSPKGSVIVLTAMASSPAACRRDCSWLSRGMIGETVSRR